MSAGLSINENTVWGTDGAVEALVDAMHREAAEWLGYDAPLTVFLRNEHETFYMGKVVFLDDWFKDMTSRLELLEVVNAGAEQLVEQGTFSGYGREWISQMVEELQMALSPPDTV